MKKTDGRGIQNTLLLIMLLITAILILSSYLNFLWYGVILSLLIGWLGINITTSSIPHLYQELRKIQNEKIQIEDTLTRKNLELQKANKELLQVKSDFLSTISHELRTPLTSIKAFTQLLLSDPKEDLKSRIEFLTIINSEVDRLTALINDLLDLTKMEAGKMEFEDKKVVIEDIIKSAINAVSSFAKEKNIEIKTQISEGIPLFIGDEEKLILLMTHLLNNAIKFSHEGGLVEINASEQELTQTIQISVKDTGIGISPQYFDVIFEKFRKIEDNVLTSEYSGAGLGLALCKEIVTHYKGKIWVESEPNKGSTFYVTLPIPTSTARVQKQQLNSLASWQPKILVVDDELNIRQFLNIELTRQGYCVIEASNGREAIEQANRWIPDLIILDLLMPEVDGFEVLKSLKTNPETKNIPVIVLSIVEEKKKAYNFGIKDYIIKPIDKNILLEKIQSILTPARRNILLISNNEKIVKTLKFGFDRKGIQVEVANNIKEALNIIQKHQFYSIILDVKMDKDKEVIDKIKDIPIVILDGDDMYSLDKKDEWVESLAIVAKEILKGH